MTLKTQVVAFLILATLGSAIHGQDQKKNGKKPEDLETQASALGYGNSADLNDVYNGDLYGQYRGHYAPHNGLATRGFRYNSAGYGGLGLPGVKEGYGNLGGYRGYYR